MSDLNISLDFIKQIKQQILQSRYTVAKIANAESLKLYFLIGKMVEEQFINNAWGSKVLDTVSAQLQQELPGLRGFSGKSISKMRTFYNAWCQSDTICSSVTSKLNSNSNTIGSLLTSQLYNADNQGENDEESNRISDFISVAFTHHYEIILKIKNETDRWYYISKAAHNFWSVTHLRTELRNKSHLQEQKLPNNFKHTLSGLLSNKAMRSFKDEYLLDFVNVEDGDDEIDERVLEHEIVQNIRKFLMSLGNDFSFMGNQYRLKVDENEYFIDLLFFHRSLQSLVAFELKKGKFKPEYAGKMNFYLSALDDLVKQPHENPSIGIILCKEKDNKTVEYSFRDLNKPMGVSVFKTSQSLPERFKKALPDSETLKKLMD